MKSRKRKEKIRSLQREILMLRENRSRQSSHMGLENRVSEDER